MLESELVHGASRRCGVKNPWEARRPGPRHEHGDGTRSESAANGAVRITVRVKPLGEDIPRPSRRRALGGHSLAAPPVDGAANDELLATLAKALGVPKRSLRLALGAASKTKVAEVAGLLRPKIIARLAAQTRPVA